METRSVPAAWFDDERMVATLWDVLVERAEEMRRAQRGR